jgi:hypothetical protein
VYIDGPSRFCLGTSGLYQCALIKLPPPPHQYLLFVL